MPRENALTVVAARFLGVPFRLFGRRPFTTPQKILIFQPCCLSQVMLTTPLLSALQQAFPQARFDWAISDWAKPAVLGHPGLSHLLSTGPASLRAATLTDLRDLVERIRVEAYDTCFIPSRSSYLAGIAWRAGIPQRVGLNINGRGFAHTFPVPSPAGEVHAASFYLALAAAVGIDTAKISRPPMVFHPGDPARKRVTERLIDECQWLGDQPLVILHPGGGDSSGQQDPRKQWPVERFVRLGNQLQNHFGAKLLLVGGEADLPRAKAIKGMTAVELVDWTGSLTLAELGALAEVADVYIGNDTGPTHIAAAMGCNTIAIFGPSNPRLSAPYGSERKKVQVLWEEEAAGQKPFDWTNGVQVADVLKAVGGFLA